MNVRLYENQLCAIGTDVGDPTEGFSVKSGVREGCIHSPVLFVILIDYRLRKCNFRGGIQLNLNRIFCDGDFIDDITLLFI